MSVWRILCLLVIIYFNKKEIDEIGRKIFARLRFEYNYWMIRRSIKKKENEWS